MVGKIITIIRLHEGYSIEYVAARAGITVDELSAIESDLQEPTTKVLKAISEKGFEFEFTKFLLIWSACLTENRDSITEEFLTQIYDKMESNRKEFEEAKKKYES